MAVTGVSQRMSSTSDLSLAGWTCTDTYQVFCTATDGPYTIATADDLPSLGEKHPDNPLARVTHVRPSPPNPPSRTLWDVAVVYETGTYTFPLSDKPLDDPVQIDWGFVPYEEAVTHTTDETPVAILNSARDPFDPPITQEVYHPVVTIVRNEASFNPATAIAAQGKINSDAVTIADYAAGIGTAKLVEYAGRKAQRSGRNYWIVTYRVEFNADTWVREVLDQGLYYLDGDDKKRCLSTNAAGNDEPAVVPMRLKSDGDQLAQNAALALTEFKSFNTYKSTVFSGLGLDIDL